MSSPLYLSGSFSAGATPQLQQQTAAIHHQHPSQQQQQQPQQHHQQQTQQHATFLAGLDFRMQAQPPYPSAPATNTLPPTPTMPRDEAPPSPYSGTDNGRAYRLKVVQEPIRARMCGFGDKDRRPITPPPCILLEVLDAATGQPIDINDVDPSYYVVTVDLWSGDGKQEVNLVRHSATSPSISATTASSYPPQPLPITHFPYGPPMGHMSMGMNPPMGGAPPPPYGYGAQGGDQYGHHQQYAYSESQRSYHYGSSTPITPTSQYANGQATGNSLLSPSAPVMITQDPRSAPTGMFTRNLIGSLCVSAFKLSDNSNQLGIWFILQDLSVRTEGTFRLKFSFVNVGSNTNATQLNTNVAPVLATCFSQQFHVFSAKKFPGVIESTPLSKCFATQGIKIPIRKDGNGRMGDDDE